MRLLTEEVHVVRAPGGSLKEPVPVCGPRRGLGRPPARMQTGYRTIGGLRVRYAESARACERTLVMTSPWPGSLEAFAPIWPVLRRRFHLLAVDLPGFGGSERAEELLAPSAMGWFLAQLIDDFRLDLVHLIGPDIGTSAALCAALRAPASIASVVVGSGGAALPARLGVPLSDWTLAANPHRVHGVESHMILDAALDRIERHIPSGALAAIPDSYAGDRFVDSMRYARRDREELPALERRLSGLRTPVLVIAGPDDPPLPGGSGQRLAQRLPNARLHTVQAGHFTWEEAADRYATILVNWVTGGYRTEGDRR